MKALISSPKEQRLVEEGYRLHMAISAWGAKKGVRAYRVLSATGEVFFEIYNPKTKTISRDFPAKIQLAIDSNTEALDAYARWSRMQNAEADAKLNRTLPPARFRFCRPTDKETRPTAEVGEHK